MKLEDFLGVHGASNLEDLDEQALADLRSFLDQGVGRNLEDAVETKKPRLRGRAAEFARMIEVVDAHIEERGFSGMRP